MTGRRSARLVAALLAVLMCSSLASAAWADTPSPRPLTDRYCGRFSEYFVVTLIVEFVAGLAEAFGNPPGDDSSDGTSDETLDDTTTTTTTEELDPEAIRSTIQVMLSPKFTALARDLSRGGPKVMRREFRRERRIFARGVELLRDAGLTDKQIDLIANAKVDTSTYDVEDLGDQIPLTDAETKELGRKFLPHSKQLTFDELEPEIVDAFEGAGVECGTIPSQDIECENVFSADDATAVLGLEVTLDDADGCRYTGASEGVDEEPEVGVVIYETHRAFDTLTKPVNGDAVAGIGERAVAFDGYSAGGRERTCGRTLIVLDHDRTIVTALCLAGDRPVDDDQLVDVAQGVIERLTTG